jgi:hypothetical protein
LPAEPTFHELNADTSTLVNREAISLHSVFDKQIGWAIDRYGCASFYTVDRSPQGHILVELTLFVERQVQHDNDVEFVRSGFAG